MSNFLILPLVLILFIAFVLGVFYLMTRYKRKMLCVCFFFVTLGFLIYTGSYLSSGEGLGNTLFAALRGTFSTARMFFTNDDHDVLASVQGTQWLTESTWMQILFWLCHLSAVIIMQVALFSLFGRKIIDKFLLRVGLHSEVYIVKGSDKNALMLGENIATHDNPQNRPDASRLVVFLLGEDEDTKIMHEKVSRFGGVVQAMDGSNVLLSCLKKAGLGKWYGKARKYYVIIMPNDISASSEVRPIVEYAKEQNVNKDSLEIFVFANSEWDRKEVEEITQMKDEGKRVYPYALHIISEVDLLVRRMIERHPPFECRGLNFGETGAAACDFTVMILGFGKVGQSALLRLVMNGQFMGSTMRAIIVDKDIDNLRDCFLHRYPSLNLCCEMDFKHFDVQCEEFFNLLNKTSNIDYVVVALSDDELNKQAAMDIRLHYERRDIMGYPFIAVSEKKGGSDELDESIFCFGRREDLYNESLIIREEVDRISKAIHEIYGGNPPWHELDWFLQESNRAAADFIPAMLKLAGLDEEKAMNKDNIAEKDGVIDNVLAEILAQTEHLRWNAFHAAMGYRPFGIEEMPRRFEKYDGVKNSRDHLDFCRRDSNTRLHVCLAPWDELDEISEAYRELAHRAGDTKEQKRDFKNNDRGIIESIPKFLRAAK